MRVASMLTALCAVPLALAEPRTAQIHIQPITTPPSTAKPQPLAEISYDPFIPESSSIVTYEAPEIPDSADLVRIGTYDSKSSQWIAGSTVASAENFSKGFSPTLILTVDGQAGEVLSTACKGVQIDAGQTRDFGPKALVIVEAKGKQPELNKPVVLSPEGKKVEEQEKTLFQKYWWVLAIVGFLVISGGGDK